MLTFSIYYLRIFIQFAYPIHDAITSYSTLNEEHFPVLLKYFSTLPFLLTAEFMLSYFASSAFFQSILLLIVCVLMFKNYQLSELSFDLISSKVQGQKGTLIENYLNLAQQKLEDAFKYINAHFFKPMKKFVMKKFKKYVAQNLLEDENDNGNGGKKEFREEKKVE